jgi:hypothetical protein
MSAPGTYQVTVTRGTLPLNPRYSTLVRSNTISIAVSPGAPNRAATTEEKPRPAFELDASLEDPDNLMPLIVRVERTNTSNHTIRERKCWTFMGMYSLAVTFNGEPLQPNGMTRDLERAWSRVDCNGNETVLEIEPGEYDADDIPVSNFFDVSKPGAYVVYVRRKTYPWNPRKSVTVESNPVSFVVPETPPDTDAPAIDSQASPSQ